MNIQLRDSKSLQDAIKKRQGRNMLPKAQLHPELHNGVVDCDRNGFVIRSEFLIDQPTQERGTANPQDIQHIKDFLPAPAECTATWKITQIKQGDSMTSIPSELVFQFDDGSKLVIHTQAVSDVTKLSSALPTDQTAKFTATPGDGRIGFVRAGSEAPIIVSPLTDAEIETQCAINGVKYDRKASRETLLKRLNEARKANETAGV